ncbi:uncharacterized protein LOC143235031 isoform X4 [Tachypleus tridentatus]|uniref:uncharacterized protein LOC143235031 isoform X4 n=1 Tax=Tachypleus tridentatus TaxID=6853 RepID=UPI003FCEEC91
MNLNLQFLGWRLSQCGPHTIFTWISVLHREGFGGTGMAYAFVDYDDCRDAKDAIKYENGREIRGQSVVVEWARGPSYHLSVYDECYHCRHSGHWARDGPELERDCYYPRRYKSQSRSRSRSCREQDDDHSKSNSASKSPSPSENKKPKS